MPASLQPAQQDRGQNTEQPWAQEQQSQCRIQQALFLTSAPPQSPQPAFPSPQAPCHRPCYLPASLLPPPVLFFPRKLFCVEGHVLRDDTSDC